MSDIQEIGRQVAQVAGDMIFWAAELEARSAELRRSAAEAAAASHADRQAHRIAAALDEAARRCVQAASSLGTARSAAEQFLAQTVGWGVTGAADAVAVADMTGMGHQQVNGTMWNGSMADIERIAARAVAFKHAIDRHFPVYEGTVFMGQNLDDEQLSRYVEGDMVVHPAFSHTSMSSEQELGGNVLFVIESETGKRVAEASQHPYEMEVTFNMSSRFQVMSKEWVPDLEDPDGKVCGRWLIYLFEV